MFKTLLHITIAIVVFIAISAYQELGMLSDKGNTKAPHFELPNLSRTDSMSLQSLQGQASVIYFFAPWCSICRLSMPNIDKLHQQGKVNAVAIALDFDSDSQVASFVADLNLTMPILLGDHSVAQSYQVKAYPTYYVLDDSLKVTERSVGYSTELGIRARL